jgi:hypothetical protein
MILKQGVEQKEIALQIYYAIGVAEAVYRQRGMQLVVTSLNDGQHMKESLHYKGLAVDLRTRDLSYSTMRSIHG